MIARFLFSLKYPTISFILCVNFGWCDAACPRTLGFDQATVGIIGGFGGGGLAAMAAAVAALIMRVSV